jgi:hypothetical protein
MICILQLINKDAVTLFRIKIPPKSFRKIVDIYHYFENCYGNMSATYD